jgi:hypothetical protein
MDYRFVREREIWRIKQYRMVFRAGLRDPCTRVSRDFWIKRKNTRAAGRCIFTLSESRATSQVHGSCYPAWKTICFIK